MNLRGSFVVALAALLLSSVATPVSAQAFEPASTPPPTITPQDPGDGYGSISGEVYAYASADGHPLISVAGVVAIVYADDSSTPIAQVTTGAGGAFNTGIIPNGTYRVRFDASAASSTLGVDALQWYNQTDYSARGDAVVVTGWDQSIDETLQHSRTISGTVTCEACSTLPNAAVRVALEASLYGNNSQTVATSPVAADGRYTLTGIWPRDSGVESVSLHVLYSGNDSFAADASTSFRFSLRGDDAPVDLFLPRHVSPVAGVADWFTASAYALYADFLHRRPTPSDILWQSHADPDTTSLFGAAAGLTLSDEYRLAVIDDAYLSTLGRASDAGGRLSWLSAIKTKLITTDDINIQLYSSQEYFEKNGDTNTRFVASLYLALLHRAGTASDYAFWSNLVVQHGRAWVVAQYWDSAETVRKRVAASYTYFTGLVPSDSLLDQLAVWELSQGDESMKISFAGGGDFVNRALTRYLVY